MSPRPRRAAATRLSAPFTATVAGRRTLRTTPSTPEDIAAAVAFLVGPDGSWINGQVLRANGGMI